MHVRCRHQASSRSWSGTPDRSPDTLDVTLHQLHPQGPIPLAEAAGALIGADVPAAKRAQAQITVERRLYDIGSILCSVGLIEKTYLGKRCAPPSSGVF